MRRKTALRYTDDKAGIYRDGEERVNEFRRRTEDLYADSTVSG